MKPLDNPYKEEAESTIPSADMVNIWRSRYFSVIAVETFSRVLYTPIEAIDLQYEDAERQYRDGLISKKAFKRLVKQHRMQQRRSTRDVSPVR